MPDQKVTVQETHKFDFEQAVAEAKRDYPKETKEIVFINTSSPDLYQQLDKFRIEAKLTPQQFENLIERAQNQEAVATVMNGHKIIAIPAERSAERGQFPGSQFKSNYFCFQHELGHFVVPKAHGKVDGAREEDWRENAADFFAVTRGIQAGVFDKKDIIDQATNRSMSSLLSYGDIHHITTMTLDAVAINPKNIDFLSLSKDDIKNVAMQHANAFEFKSGTHSQFSDMMSAGKKVFDLEDKSEAIKIRLNILHDICRDAPANSQAFYLAARILDKVMEVGAVTNGKESIKIDTSGDEWKKTRDIIAEKSGDRDIGGKKALETSSFVKTDAKEQGFVSLVRNKIKPLKI